MDSEGMEEFETEIKKFTDTHEILMYAECSALQNVNIVEPVAEFYSEIIHTKPLKLKHNFLSSRRKVELKSEAINGSCC